AFAPFLDHLRNQRGRMLQVRIDRHYYFSVRNSEPSQQRGLLAEVTGEPKPLDASVRDGPLLDALEGRVAPAVVDNADLQPHAAASERGRDDLDRMHDPGR